MTNKEAIREVIGFDASDLSMDKALEDASVDPGDTYSPSNKKKIDLCAVEVMKTLLSRPNISEGGFSISFDRDAVKYRIQEILERNGMPTGKPTVRIRNLW